MRTQSNYMGKAKLQKKVLTTIMTGFLFAGISNTALAENVSVPDSKTDGQTIGAGNTAAGDGWSVEVGSDNNKSVYSVGDKNAISLRDNATIHIKKNAVVTNAANRNIGNFGTGANTIEVRSGSKITVDGTVQKYGQQNMGEAINVHGGGNTIVVNGSVIAEKSAAIWFQDWTGTGNDSRNSVINNGLIQRTDGGNVIGTSGGNGIDFTNNGTVNGSLFFAKGDDNLTFMPGSNVTGNIDGGGGKNKLNLDGGNDKVGGTLNGAIKNFTSLTKKGTGLWEITGPMQGFDTVDVQQGTLGLSGNNDGFTGKITVRKDASLSAKAESLPVNHPVNGNVGNIDLTNGGTLIFEQDDNGSYQGQIIGDGSVIKTGSGIVALRPDAGANTYSGVTTIDGGGLAISSQDALGTNSDLTINNGSLTAEANLTIDKRINLASAEANKTAVIDTNGHNVTAAGVLNGVVDSGTFIKIGAGTLTAANNDNSFAGNVEVAGGALQIDGSGSKNFTGKIRVLHEAFLQGSGKVAGDVVNAGWLAPGSYNDKFGTFTVGGNYTGQPGGKLSIYSVLGGDASPTSKLVVEGDTEGSPTNIRVINQNGSGGYTDKGILVVDVRGKSDPNAFTLAFDLANKTGADLILATDPDSDRLGVAVRGRDGRFQVLTGNQIGSILIHYILSTRNEHRTLPGNGLVVRSIVSTRMADAICAYYGVELREVLTGFRFISEQIAESLETKEHTFLFGFEESYGFLSGCFSRDKDAICAAMLLAEAATVYELQGRNLYDVLQEMYAKYGFYGEAVKSYTLKGKEGLEKIAGAMRALRADKIAQFGGVRVVKSEDIQTGTITYPDGREEKCPLPKSNVLRYFTEGDGWLCVRPSGTEPKLKLYIGAKGSSEAELKAELSRLMTAADGMISELLK